MNARCLLRSIHLLILAVALVTLGPSLLASAQEKVIYNFQGAPDGVSSYADLIMDAKGSLYGTTKYGGTGTCATSNGPTSCGTVFRLSPPSTIGGAWTETILYNFLGPGGDGAWPQAPLRLDKNGNLYGTTTAGGNGTICASGNFNAGCGTIFQLSAPVQAGGAWTETTLYNFQDNGDGYVPVGRLAMDAKGNLYGVTVFDGTAGLGVVYQLSAPAQSGGSWTEAVIYNFQGSGDGSLPQGGLIFGRQGNLFGVTNAGGAANLGIIFQLSSSNQGQSWNETVLHSFLGGSDGANPSASLILDANGNLYGTTSHGGSSTKCFQAACGTVFSLTRNAGSWTEQVLYSFKGGSDGQYPYAGVAFDKKGNLYGTTSQGGSVSLFFGTIFRLTPNGTGWQEQVAHSFKGSPDGDVPMAGLLLAANGNFYGTTSGSAVLNGIGTVFELHPKP